MIEVNIVKSNWFYSQRNDIKRYIEDKFNVSVKVNIIARKMYDYKFGSEVYTLQKVGIIINKDNNKKFLFDPHDHSNHIYYLKDILNKHDDVVHIMKAQFDPTKVTENEDIEMGMYYPKNLQEYLSALENIKIKEINKREKNKIFFGGKQWRGRRRIISRINKDIIHVHSEKLGYSDFIKELGEYKVILSLPGHGNLCHREFEAFGVGTPVIMPKLMNQLADPLIPNEHYISVEPSSDNRLVAKRIEEKYHEVIENEEFLNKISRNCLEWHKRNNTYPNCYKVFDKGITKILS